MEFDSAALCGCVESPSTKRSVSLHPRLEAAAALLGKTSVLADIGCDHGRFSAAMLQRGIAEKVIASDISAPSLKKAEQLANVCGLSSKMECRISNGFSAYSAGETDKAVILGMGGEVIRSILSRSDSFARSLECIVMQPMRGEAELRSYLYSNNYRIIDEAVVFDSGRYYQLISAKNGAPCQLPDCFEKGFFQFGAEAFNKRDPMLLPLMQRYLCIIEKKLQRAALSGGRPKRLVFEAESTAILISAFLNGRNDDCSVKHTD